MKKAFSLIKKRCDYFLILCFLLFGFTVWFFPKSVDSQKFLGFSDPFLLYKPEVQKQRGQRTFLKERKPSAEQSGK